MSLDLFTRTSNKSELQRSLDRERDRQETASLDEFLAPAPEAQSSASGKPLFNRVHAGKRSGLMAST